MDFNLSTEYDALDYKQVERIASTCPKCDLCKSRTQVVFGYGPVPCNVMVIGEGPGEQEDKEGKPFVGRAGQLLTKIFESVGIDREKEVYITNVVKCRPPNNRTPFPGEIAACNPYLRRQIHLVQPKVLLLLGAAAAKTILADEKLSITKVRGQWFHAPVTYMSEPLYVMPMFHPSYLLRNESREKGSPKWLTWQDMKEVKAAMEFYMAA